MPRDSPGAEYPGDASGVPARSTPAGSQRLHAVIMAGGSGTRFWPMSRRSLPKQFLALAGEKSLLRETFDRLEPLVGADRIWIVAGESHLARVRSEAPELPEQNLLGEPAPRNTAPCIGLAAWRILEREEDATILVCPSDHVVRPAEVFRARALTAARFLDAPGDPGEPWTVTFGITPRYPATGFGYIERAGEIPGVRQAYRVARFKEKPPLETAREYAASGRFFWNSGIFLWKARGVADLIRMYLPDLASGLDEVCRRAPEDGLPTALRDRFGALPAVSIDYGVLERQRNVAVFGADFDWDDVGSWRAVERYAPTDSNGNSLLGKHIAIESRNCILAGKKRLIAALGVEGLVIVETDDAILVCRRDETERVKAVVEQLERENRTDLL